jgi:uncharacterized glyoxalase superfamily protein PhnB
MIMIEAEWPRFASRTPALDGSSPVAIFVKVEDVDAVVERAVAAGAKILAETKNQFWGDRNRLGHGPGGARLDNCVPG